MSKTGGARVIDGTTEFVGVIGDPVAHSMSPRLHNRAYEALGLNLAYGAFRVPVGGVAEALRGARALGFRGLSVTTPHKQEAALLADQRSNDVVLLGAANTVLFQSGVVVAESTDGRGFLDDLARNCDVSPKGMSCGVIGAGGAARAIILDLARAGARELIIVNRTQQRAVEAAALAPEVAHVGMLGELSTCEIVINATSLGLAGATGPEHDGGASLAALLGPHQLAIDLSYRPARSPFLSAAAERGARIRNGLGMLVHQAGWQVRLFTGVEPPLSAMWEVVNDLATS